MDDLECEIVDEKLHKGALGYDILSADLDGEDAFLLNIRVYCTLGIPNNIGCLVCRECVWKVP